MNTLNSLKYLFLIGIIIVTGLWFYKFKYDNYPIKKSSLVDEYKQADFLNLNEKILQEGP